MTSTLAVINFSVFFPAMTYCITGSKKVNIYLPRGKSDVWNPYILRIDEYMYNVIIFAGIPIYKVVSP